MKPALTNKLLLNYSRLSHALYQLPAASKIMAMEGSNGSAYAKPRNLNIYKEVECRGSGK